jgi:hypothetical protein
LVWAVLIIAGIFFFIVSPGFRVLVLVIAGLAAAALLLFFQAENKRSEERRATLAREQARDSAAWVQVRPEQIQLRDIRFAPTYRMGSNQVYSVEGSIKNNAGESITKVALSVVAHDCPAGISEYSRCEIIGRASTDLTTEVPPGEVRAINGGFQIDNLPKPTGELRFTYSASRVRTKW